MSEQPTLSAVAAFAWTIAAASLLLWILRAALALFPTASPDVVVLGAVEAGVFALAATLVHLTHGSPAGVATTLGLRRVPPGLLVIGVALGFAAHFPAEAVDDLVSSLAPEEAASDLAAQAELLAARTPLRMMAVAAVVAGVGPVVEELFFRGVMFRALRRGYGPLASGAVSGACFVIGHLNHRKWPALAVVALVLSLLRVESGSVVPALAMHVAFNGVTVAAAFAADGRATPVRVTWLPALAGAAATAALSLTAAAVARRARHGVREDQEDAS